MNLTRIETEILHLHNSVNVRPTVDAARKIGELLLEVKAYLDHGQYLPWVRKLGLSRQFAQAYTQVAKAHPVNDQSSGHLSIDGLLKRIRQGRRAERRERTDQLTEDNDNATEEGIVLGDSLKWLP
ncbi:hypothetical protein [Limnoglobus roseus]|uniref:Site-specific DNA-methyltransferase n=1 Tax=Limnoglobus roseus TaxID=2598579 RepID=A0A5C1ALZ4_9BACT|nr:hypothetical protein [Limnoglobus roseus]QEL19207.1 site-specific DNA-methyltransferase [Limnoglobus roseus]